MAILKKLKNIQKMRNRFLTLAFAAAAFTSQAQIQATVHEETRVMSQGSKECLVLDLPGTTPKNVEHAWKSFMKDYKGKTDFEKKTGEFFSDDVTIKDLSPNTVDVYAKIVAKGDMATEVTVWYNVGLDYLSSAKYPTNYPAAEKMLKAFTKMVSLEMIENELKEQEKKLKEYEAQLKELEKAKASREADIAKYQATIAEMNANIEKANADISKNVTDQGTKNGEITTQKQVVDSVKQRLEQVKAGN